MITLEVRDPYDSQNGEPADSPVLDALSYQRIFTVSPDGDGFRFTEACDRYFAVRLTREQMRALAAELLALADGAEPGPAAEPEG